MPEPRYFSMPSISAHCALRRPGCAPRGLRAGSGDRAAHLSRLCREQSVDAADHMAAQPGSCPFVERDGRLGRVSTIGRLPRNEAYLGRAYYNRTASVLDRHPGKGAHPGFPLSSGFVQSGFNKVALTPALRAPPCHAASQNPPDSLGLESLRRRQPSPSSIGYYFD